MTGRQAGQSETVKERTVDDGSGGWGKAIVGKSHEPKKEDSLWKLASK